jgi:hypothetical protein
LKNVMASHERRNNEVLEERDALFPSGHLFFVAFRKNSIRTVVSRCPILTQLTFRSRTSGDSSTCSVQSYLPQRGEREPNPMVID